VAYLGSRLLAKSHFPKIPFSRTWRCGPRGQEVLRSCIAWQVLAHAPVLSPGMEVLISVDEEDQPKAVLLSGLPF
jgi:hypothetical protein